MAPKRQKKHKARQVRHHQAVKHAQAQVTHEHIDAATAGADEHREVTGAPHAHAESASAADLAPVAVEQRPPALDIWPDFEEVVFPPPAGERRERPSTSGRADLEASVASRSDETHEPEARQEPPRERRRAPRATPTPVSTGEAGTAVLDEDQSWLIGAASHVDDPATHGRIDDDLDEDEREAIRRDVAPSRTAAAVVEDDAIDVESTVISVVDDTPREPAVVATPRRPTRGRFAEHLRDRGVARPLRTSEVVGMFGALALALLLWVQTMRQVRLEHMDDLGLISALPATTVIPFALLIVSFTYCLWRAQTKTLLLAIHTVVLVVMTYAIRALYVPVPSYKVAYRHIGVSDLIGQTGTVDSSIDAYFNWPGFFTYAEGLAKAAGFETIEAFANLAPLAYNLLYLAPALVIMRTITSDQRVVWIGVWAFFLANWVSQDYLSPQGLAYFLHLVVVAIVLRWFMRSRSSEESAPSTPVMAGLATVLVVMAYMIPSHQLTPYATIFALFALMIARRLTTRAMPIIVGFMAATWLVLMATDYLSGHGSNVTGGGQALGDTVASNVGDRLAGTAQRVFVVQGRVLFSLVFLLLAMVGAFRMFRRRKLNLAHILIPASAFVLIPIQPYGGEIVFRVFLLALPFAAAFATIALMPRRDGRFGATVPLVAAAWVVFLLGAFTITRYGNERMDTFTKDEIAATQYLYNAPGVATAKRRSLLALGGSDNLPWKARAYATFQWKTLVDLEEWKAAQQSPRIPAQKVVEAARLLMRHYPDGAYLIFTRSQVAEVDLTGASPRGSLQRVEAAVKRSPWFRTVFQNADARIYVLTSAGRAKDEDSTKAAG